jgi:hypothetical protein
MAKAARQVERDAEAAVTKRAEADDTLDELREWRDAMAQTLPVLTRLLTK